MNVVKLIASDYRKFQKYGGNFFTIVFLTQGFWAIFQYRIAHFLHTKVTFLPLRFIFKVIMLLWQKAIEISTGISIPASAKIGPSFYIGHFGGIILNANAVIGSNCNIAQGVTIGISGKEDNRGVPIIGDNVYIGVNTVVAGKITVQDNALLGSCSLITSNVEANAVMVGVPAVLISNQGSKGYI